MTKEEVDRFIEEHLHEKEALLGILTTLQKKERYLSHDTLERLSQRTGIPMARIYSIATFYNAFSLKPQGKHRICICIGTSCVTRRSPLILERTEKILGVKTGSTTSDGRFTLSTVRCLGCCGTSPTLQIDDRVYGRLNLENLKTILEGKK